MPLQSWRLFLPLVQDPPMDLDEELFQALIFAKEKQKQQKTGINWDEITCWSADERRGSLTLFFEDSTELTAKTQLIGTFDSENFFWAWSNPLIHDDLKIDSLKLKALGEKQGWSILTTPSFNATRRDCEAILALAAKEAQSDGAYAAEAEGCIFYYTLYDIPESSQPCLDPPEFEHDSVLDELNELMAEQLLDIQIDLMDLREVESICMRGFIQRQTGDYKAAIQSYDEAWEKLGEFAFDQEPASWIKMAKGDAYYLAGDYKKALAEFTEAEQLFDWPDIAFLFQRMGQCYAVSGDNEKANDMFARVFVTSGEDSLDELSNSDRNLFLQELDTRRKSAIKKIEKRRVQAEAEKPLEKAAAIVECFINEHNIFERSALEKEATARKGREIVNETGEEDLKAQSEINTQWSWLMAVWCTPKRWPLCNNIQFPPAHDPEVEKIKQIIKSNGVIAVETVANDSFGCTIAFRYELEEANNGNLLIRQIYSVWDGEEHPCI